jgi:hypothetical protein
MPESQIPLSMFEMLKLLAYSTKWDPSITLLPDTPKGSTYKKGSKP